MASATASDAELMAAVGRNDMAALGELVRRHQDKALGLALRMLRRRDAAEDIAQEAFLRVFRAAKRYRPDAKFTTWLYRIVANLCLDRQRRAKQAPLGLDEAGTEPSAEPAADPIEAGERVARVRRALDALSERQRTAVLLHRYEGLSHREIADVMESTESAVESLIVRAYAKLRRLLADLEE